MPAGNRGHSGAAAADYLSGRQDSAPGIHSGFGKFSPGVVLFRQQDYAHIPYPSTSYPAATVATGGCGPTALAIVLRNLLGLEITPEETAAFALECGARAASGTNMRRLAAQAALCWPLTVETANNTAALLSALQGGAVAVCNVSGDRAGHKGIFSTGGHYVVVVAGDADCIQVLDPGTYPGKYLAAYRAEAVTQLGEVLLCAPETLENDCQNRNPMYYIFRAK